MKESGGYMETYSWAKFYPDHCSDKIVSMMIKESVRIKWDEIPVADDFVDALVTLDDVENREWLYCEYKENNDVSNELLFEYLTCIGDDELFRTILGDFKGSFTHDFVVEFIAYGMEEEDLKDILSRYDGSFSGDEALELFGSYNVPNDIAAKIISNRIDSLDGDQIEEIINCIDERLYPLMLPYISRLPFDRRVELMDDYGLEPDDAPLMKKRNKDEPSPLFEKVAMATAVMEGIRQGIKGEDDPHFKI